jgi:hypothetical protein
MGKKSRAKKHRKSRVQKTPDEAITLGPLRIERYGRHIRFSNNSTPEQHAAFLERSREANKQVLIDLERELVVLQALIPKYDAVELLHRAAYMLIPLFMKYRSEGEFQGEESYFLPTVEYLQYLIARTEANTDGKTPSEVEWEEIWTQALKVLHLTQSHLLARGDDHDASYGDRLLTVHARQSTSDDTGQTLPAFLCRLFEIVVVAIRAAN